MLDFSYGFLQVMPRLDFQNVLIGSGVRQLQISTQPRWVRQGWSNIPSDSQTPHFAKQAGVEGEDEVVTDVLRLAPASTALAYSDESKVAQELI